MIVLIPAYEPDEKLIGLVERLFGTGEELSIVVVDDGSGPDYDTVFAAVARLGCTVIGHSRNRGKGFALKRGFEHVESHFPGHDVVCADCDGQHNVDDILRVARKVATAGVSRSAGARSGPAAMVLGGRRFTGRVPATSRFGNAVTRIVFARATGQRLYDTQTGLRAYPHSMLPWLCSVGGDRFEYELDVLLHASEAGMTIREVPIQTIYLEGNASSHFRPLVDSARVYAPLVKFSLSSIAAFAVDVVLLFVVNALTANLLLSVVAARVVSANVNFLTNRRVVFARGPERSMATCAARYFALAGTLMIANFALLHVLYEHAQVNLVIAKLTTEAALFLASYQVQKRVVFGHCADAPVPTASAPMVEVSARSERRTATV